MLETKVQSMNSECLESQGPRKARGAPMSLLERGLQFAKFCAVGVSGLLVDTGILYLLADPKALALNVMLSKVCAAEAAMLNNFFWNEVWTFRQSDARTNHKGWISRLLKFQTICGIGIALAVLLLYVFHTWLGWNLYASNLGAIILVTCWNFFMNARFNWR